MPGFSRAIATYAARAQSLAHSANPETSPAVSRIVPRVFSP
jgi:hypothetical protein